MRTDKNVCMNLSLNFKKITKKLKGSLIEFTENKDSLILINITSLIVILYEIIDQNILSIVSSVIALGTIVSHSNEVNFSIQSTRRVNMRGFVGWLLFKHMTSNCR